MGKEVLTEKQKIFLETMKNSKFAENFYFTGGTALSSFYLNHRISEDLDFFTEKEVETLAVNIFLKSIKEKIGFKSTDYQSSFNRNMFFLHFKNKEVLKVEFTYFPFPRIEKGKKEGKLVIDSLTDIAVNKVFAISQNPRARDFIDIYFILKEIFLEFKELVKKARMKFDWHIDAIQFGTMLSKVRDFTDFPRMIKEFDKSHYYNFFIKEAKKFSKEIVRD